MPTFAHGVMATELAQRDPGLGSTGAPAPPVEGSRSPRKTPLVNRVMARLLRSRLSRLVDRGVMLLAVTGRRTGRTYTFPVQYVQDGRVLWVYAGADDTKTWWRNLVGGADVEVLLRRRLHAGTARAYPKGERSELVEEGLRRYRSRFPSVAERFGLRPGQRAGEQAAARTVMVRIELAPGGAAR